MSSEISTDAGRLPAPAKSDTSFQPWQLFTLLALISGSFVAYWAGSYAPPVRVALILAVFAAAAIGVAMLRTLAPFTMKGGPAAPQIIGGRTRAALEREKLLALRSIKELEFDRAMGKISESDFAEMSARLRARAARLIRDLDAHTGYRGEIEREIERRLSASPSAADAGGHGPAGSRAQEAGAAAPAPVPAAVCASCGTRNDADARFCKACGTRFEP